MKPTLSVLARGTGLVPRFDQEFAAHGATRRFVGRTYNEADRGWHPNSEPTTVPNMPEFRLAVQSGDLWAADAETATECEVKFDPTFGASR